jgi:hypothetical protein
MFLVHLFFQHLRAKKKRTNRRERKNPIPVDHARKSCSSPSISGKKKKENETSYSRHVYYIAEGERRYKLSFIIISLQQGGIISLKQLFVIFLSLLFTFPFFFFFFNSSRRERGGPQKNYTQVYSSSSL